MHPRTAVRLAAAGFDARLAALGVRLIEPLPYIAFMSLVLEAGAVITDSGGLQEETTYLGIPCFTLRENTERPITIEQGSNRLKRVLVGDDHLARGISPPIHDQEHAIRLERPRAVGRWGRRRAERHGNRQPERPPVERLCRPARSHPVTSIRTRCVRAIRPSAAQPSLPRTIRTRN